MIMYYESSDGVVKAAVYPGTDALGADKCFRSILDREDAVYLDIVHTR